MNETVVTAELTYRT